MTTVRWPSTEPVAGDARRDRSFSSCFVRAMSIMLAMPLLGGAIVVGAAIAVPQVFTIAVLLGWAPLLGLAAGFGVGMHLVTTRIWGHASALRNRRRTCSCATTTPAGQRSP